MDQEKFNLVNEEEIEEKSYEELKEMEKELMNNPEATDLDLAYVSAIIIDREEKMGIFEGYTIDEVFGRLLKDSSFDKNKFNNKENCLSRIRTNI